MEVHVNQQNLHETALLLKKNGAVLASGEDMRRWHLYIPSKSALTYEGKEYYAIQSLTDVSYQIDESNQTLLINVKANRLPATRIDGSPVGLSTPDSPPFGGFINYDVIAQSSRQQTLRLDSMMELSVFNQWGVGVSNVLARDLGANPHLIRMDSTWTIDQPDRLSSIRFGDSVSNAGAWGRPVRFGGVQWATNFNTQPGFITFPMPSITGEAVLPSTVDIFVDNNRLLNQQVAPGPFTISNVRGITGLREMRMAVRDIMGREQIISQPYYASPQLLKPDLQEFSYEIGSVRENFGIVSNDYGRWLAVGSHRIGLNAHFTGEWHAELLQNQQNLGLGGVFLLPSLGVFDAAFAGSHSRKGEGSLLSLGFQRQASSLSAGGHVQFASRDFSQLGLLPDRPAPKLLSSFHLGISTAGLGNFNVSHIYQAYRDQNSAQLINVSYNYTLGDGWFLNLVAFKSLNHDNNDGMALTISHALGERTNVSLMAGLQNDSPNSLLHLQRNLPPGSGLGYRVLAGHDGSERLDTGVSLQNDVGTYNLDASLFQGQYNLRGSASGGIALMGGDAFFSRRLTNSFAVVQVPDYPNVHVYAENQPVATTNASGNALVTSLRPYQDNHIRIEQADLPLDAQIDTLELNAKPYFRSGAVLKFPVRRSRGATLKIVLNDGKPLPAGATVQIMGQKEEFPVALQGQVYITGLAQNNDLRIVWHEQSCKISVTYLESKDPLPDLGTLICDGVSP